MLLSITTTHGPATDLGCLLHKNPNRVQEFSLSFGTAHVFYPEARPERCTAALLVSVDPVGLVRNRRGGPSGEGGLLDQYVNDRPYAASSFLSVAMGQVFRTAMAGRCSDRPGLAETPIPLELFLPAVPGRGGEALLRALFEPLGYGVAVERLPLDPRFPDWGESLYFSLGLTATKPLKDALSHLYVLIPVLDDDKHYWVGDDEVDKLVRHGAEWLARHPEREQIARRYLNHKKSLARIAIDRLLAAEEADVAPEDAAPVAEQETKLEAPLSLNQQRMQAVLAAVRDSGAGSVLDLGCGEGRLLGAFMKERQLAKVAGMDVSIRVLENAASRLKLERLPPLARAKIDLIHGSLTYRDRRLEGFDTATVVEVVEHLDADRLTAFERVLFQFARPRTVVLTTPNIEHNVRFEGLAPGRLRHADHRFEWTRAQFRDWANGVASRHGYGVAFQGIGEDDPEVGAPTQMAVFRQG